MKIPGGAAAPPGTISLRRYLLAAFATLDRRWRRGRRRRRGRTSVGRQDHRSVRAGLRRRWRRSRGRRRWGRWRRWGRAGEVIGEAQQQAVRDEVRPRVDVGNARAAGSGPGKGERVVEVQAPGVKVAVLQADIDVLADGRLDAGEHLPCPGAVAVAQFLDA